MALKFLKRLAVPKRLGHPWRVHSRIREALEVVIAHRLQLGWRRSNATQLRADAKAGRGLAEE
jgi:hypothetical protein